MQNEILSLPNTSLFTGRGVPLLFQASQSPQISPTFLVSWKREGGLFEQVAINDSVQELQQEISVLRHEIDLLRFSINTLKVQQTKMRIETQQVALRQTWIALSKFSLMCCFLFCLAIAVVGLFFLRPNHFSFSLVFGGVIVSYEIILIWVFLKIKNPEM